jgi:excisionase family DNA binding protein
MPDQWGTMEDAAKMIATSVDTIRRMITRGEIEAKRFGPRLIRVNLTTLEASGKPLVWKDPGAS